jgi:hypothetical protein
MGTAQVTVAVELPEVTLVTWPKVMSVTWPEVCTISALVGTFDRKWQSHVTGRGHVRKRSWPEVGSAHERLFPPAFFFLVVVPWPPNVTEDHLIPSRFPWMCACATRSCATPVVTEGHVTPSEVSLGSYLRRPRPIIIGNSASYN